MKQHDDDRPFTDIEEDRPRANRELVSNCTADGKTLYGWSWQSVTRLAIAWWDLTGRHVIRNPEWQDPDVGVPSGIMRGLPFDALSRREALRVVHVYERTQMRPHYREQIVDWFRTHRPDLLSTKDPQLDEWIPEDVRANDSIKQVVDVNVQPDKL